MPWQQSGRKPNPETWDGKDPGGMAASEGQERHPPVGRLEAGPSLHCDVTH